MFFFFLKMKIGGVFSDPFKGMSESASLGYTKIILCKQIDRLIAVLGIIAGVIQRSWHRHIS